MIVNSKDSDAAPHIMQKNVILCRSGIQMYHRSELAGFMSESDRPPVEKEWYREYRPASVVVKAKEKCSTLAVTKEHPAEWVTPDNFGQLAGGVTDKAVEVVALEGESEGEIGLQSDLTFFTNDLYNYYLDGNKEVSLGYTCRKHWVENPEEVGYDIILDEILEVNHLAVTRSGRGGSSVAVADRQGYPELYKKLFEKTEGAKMLRTNIFSFLRGKQKDSSFSFGEKVLEAVKSNKNTTEASFEKDYKAVLDSLADFKESKGKELLVNAVHDCADNREKSLAEKDELVAVFDSMFNALEKEAKDEYKSAVKDSDESEEKKDSEEEKKAEDSEEEKKDSEKEEENKDSEEEKKEDSDEEKEEKSEDSDEEKKEEKDGCGSKDSLKSVKEEILNSVKDSIKSIVQEAVKETLGLSSAKDSKFEGGEAENAASLADYSEFLD